MKHEMNPEKLHVFMHLLIGMVRATAMDINFTMQDSIKLWGIIEHYAQGKDIPDGYRDALLYHVFCAYDALGERAILPDELEQIIKMGATLYKVVLCSDIQ